MKQKKRGDVTPVVVLLTSQERLMLHRLATVTGETLSGAIRSMIHEKSANGVIDPVIAPPPKPVRQGVPSKIYPQGHVGNLMAMSLDQLMRAK